MDAAPISSQALIEAVAAQASSQDPLVLLATAVSVAGQAGVSADAMVDHYVGAARAAGRSWTEIGQELGISKQAARQRFSPRLETRTGTSADLPPLAPRLVACLEVAQSAADADNSVPGTQHLLLGLLHVGVAANVLDRLGVTRDAVCEASARLLRANGDTAGGQRVVGDGEAETAVLTARRFAADRGQHLTRTEHVLFILAMDPGSSARRVLDDLNVDVGLARIKKELGDLVPPPPRRGRRGRRSGKPDQHGRACSFCGCADPNRAMVNGPGVRICSDCVTLATDIVAAARTQSSPFPRRLQG
jgi:ATP-dependent Clp protease ATP-binding subunit ClpA